MEGDGGGGLGDPVDVRGGDRSVERTGCEENGDGEFITVAAENEFPKLYHGRQMANPWSWVNNYGVFLHFHNFESIL